MGTHNRTVLQQLLYQYVTNFATVLNFRTEEYDQVTRAYFVAFTPYHPPLNALIHKLDNRTIDLQIGSAVTISSTQLYSVNFAVMPPAPRVQVLTVATSPSNVREIQWGGSGVM